MPGSSPASIASSTSVCSPLPSPPIVTRSSPDASCASSSVASPPSSSASRPATAAGIVDRGGTGDDGRAGADVGGLDEARSLRVERHLAGHRIDHEQPVAGGREDRGAVLRDGEAVDRDAEVGDLERLDALRPADVELGEVERVQLPGLGCGEQLARGRIVGQGARRAEVVSRDLGARAEVVAADPRVRREPQPCARLVAGRDVRVARLDQRVVDRGADRARRADPVVAERGDPGRDQVLAEVRVGPLVDVALVAVPPVLEELGRGARVVDLVEVHVQRLRRAGTCAARAWRRPAPRAATGRACRSDRLARGRALRSGRARRAAGRTARGTTGPARSRPGSRSGSTAATAAAAPRRPARPGHPGPMHDREAGEGRAGTRWVRGPPPGWAGTPPVPRR